MFYSYILFSKKHNRYYVGSTANLEKRLASHNSGSTKSTKSFRPWVLIYEEHFETKTEARKRELQIKKYKGGRAFKKLVQT